MNHTPESLLALKESPDMKTDTPPQPAHGEPLTYSELFGLPDGSLVKLSEKADAYSEAWPDTYEVHSKEAMDEVRDDLTATAVFAEAFLAQFHSGKKISLERWVDNFKVRANNARATLAKLNSPQE